MAMQWHHISDIYDSYIDQVRASLDQEIIMTSSAVIPLIIKEGYDYLVAGSTSMRVSTTPTPSGGWSGGQAGIIVFNPPPYWDWKWFSDSTPLENSVENFNGPTTPGLRLMLNYGAYGSFIVNVEFFVELAPQVQEIWRSFIGTIEVDNS